MTSRTDVSMLWESVDPGTALTTRFDFTDADHAVAWLADLLRQTWGVGLDHCERLVISARNLLAWLDVDGRRVIAKCSADPERFTRLVDVADMTAWLHREGIPVAVPVAASDGRLQVESGGRSIGLQPVVEGDLLDVGDPEQVEHAGGMLATLHQALAAYPGRIGTGPDGAGRQLVQNDFRSANLLAVDGRITAILDFEEIAYRNRVRDLAQASVLLGTRYHDWGPTSPATRDSFVRAYSDVLPLSDADSDILRRGTDAVLTHFGWT